MPISPEYQKAVLRGALTLDTINQPNASPDSPDYERDEYSAMIPAVRRSRTLFAGTDAMRKAGETFLPRLAKELAEDWDRRKKVTRLFNAYRRTIRAYVGMITRKPPRLIDAPPVIEEHAENIDLAGRDLPTFLADVAEDALIAGHCGILVDYPATMVTEEDGTTRPMNRLEEAESEVRPYWIHVRLDDVPNWRYEYRNGRPVLTLLVIREMVTEDEGAFGTQRIEQIRVVRPFLHEIWRETKEGVWEIVEERATSMEEIPFSVVYAGRTGFMTSEPPLTDLIHENIGHWQEYSEHAGAVARNRIVMPFFSGFDPGDVIWGNNYSITATTPDATATMLEVTGRAMEASDKEIARIEERMAALGLSMLVRESRAAETASAKMMDKTESDSALARFAHSLNDAVDLALWYHADWMGVDRKAVGSVEVNTDYSGLKMSPQMVQALSTLEEKGQFPMRLLLAALQRGELLPDGEDTEQLAEELESEAERQMEAMMRIGMAPGQQPEGDDEDVPPEEDA